MPLGPVTSALAAASYGGATGFVNGMEIVDDPLGNPARGRVLMHRVGPTKGGYGDLHASIGTGTETKLYFFFEIYLPAATSDIGKGGKLCAGLYTGELINVTGQAASDQGWSARVGWQGPPAWTSVIQAGFPGDNTLEAYVYYEERPTPAGQSSMASRPTPDPSISSTAPPAGSTCYGVEKGRWVPVEFMVEMVSTPGAGDGKYHMWIDGKQVNACNDVRWCPTGKGPYYITDFRWNPHVGGNDSTFNLPFQELWFFDNITISRNPIGPRV